MATRKRARPAPARETRAAIPLRYRLPNPPPVFVGRGAESAHLARALERAPLALVWGLGGLGKTSLVLHTLQRYFPARVERTVVANLRAGDARAQVLVETLRALAEAAGHRPGSWRGALGDHDALVAAAIDLAESADLWVLLDDLHHADPAAVRALLEGVARYARTSRWIAVGRVDPQLPALAGQTIALGALAESELAALARECAPARGEAEVRRAVAAAAGSPWRLQQIVADQDPHGDERSLLRGLAPPAARFLELLAVLVFPLEPATLARIAPLPGDDALAALQARGLVRRGAEGVCIHEVARPVVLDAMTTEDLAHCRARAAAALRLASEPAAVLEAVRLALEAGDPSGAAHTLAAHGERLLTEGHGPRLWTLLEAHGRDAVLRRFRTRCAVALGDAATLARIEGPASAEADDQLLWIDVLVHTRRVPEALEVAGALLAEAVARGDTALAFHAGLRRAKCFILSARPDAARDALLPLVPPDPGSCALRDAYLARTLGVAGRHAEALAVLERVQITPPADAPQGPAEREAAEQVATVLALAGRMREADALLAGIVARLSAEPVARLAGETLLASEAATALGSGRLGRVREIHAHYDAPNRRGTHLAGFVRRLEYRRRAETGELAGLEALIDEELERCRAHGPGDGYEWMRVVRARLALLRADAPPPPGFEHAPPVATVTRRQLLELIVRQHALLHGADARPPARPIGDADPIHVQIGARTVDALAAALAGDGPTALASAARALGLAREHGWRIAEANACLVQCEALLVLGHARALASSLAALAALAEALPSALHASEARLIRMAAPGALDPVALEALARGTDTAPAAARRARALLGAPGRLDALDRRVVTATERASGQRIESLAPREADADAPGWYLDFSRRAVCLPGRRVDLGTSETLWSVLATLASNGGAVSKEVLVRAVWNAPGYHPLRDDKRMQVAVRRLRVLVEDDPAAPARVVTTPDGYALSAAVPVRLLRALGDAGAG